MSKPQGLGPRLVAIQNAGITKEQAAQQLTIQEKAGVPQANMVFTNPKTGAVVAANPTAQAKPVTVQEIATSPTMNVTAQAGQPDILAQFINGILGFFKKIGLGNLTPPYKTNQWDGLTPPYKTNQWDGTIDDLGRGRM
jgi:hypothetical protein